ncbi:MAG: aminotransferase class I/II-fold pyridoxal phosphate-dependent enzyme [Gemmatimonadetes bacterium]|nr:aminotransferase class I/II-fold pyridoxal phosphate-dependent enzyme [Gemmatimonadota bacterium]
MSENRLSNRLDRNSSDACQNPKPPGLLPEPAATGNRRTKTTEVIDLRSDTVTVPSEAMRSAIAEAEVGDDVLDGDPTTRKLEARVAHLLGHEAALFFPSGTQANQVALGLLTDPGTEVVIEDQAHMVHYEEAGAAALWGVQLRTVASPDGVLTPDLIADAIRDGDPFFPSTTAIVIENTHSYHGGKITDLAVMEAVRDLARARGLALHIDGARLWNAAVALGEPPGTLARFGTTVMVSFTKGLGCPVGACLAGPKTLIERGVELRRRLGGAMRQSGILAAACLFALDRNMERLADDHARARLLADTLRDHAEVTPVFPDTNIVMLDLRTLPAQEAARLLARSGVLVSVFGPQRLRVVAHLGVTEDEVRYAAETIAHALG